MAPELTNTYRTIKNENQARSENCFYVGFRSRNVQFSVSSRKSAELRGGILLYAAQAVPPIDAEIAEKGHFWTETIWPAAAGSQVLRRRGLWFLPD